MSTTTSYRAFTRKYQQAREAMRRRELGMRVLEGRLDEQDRAVMKTQEANRLEVSALKKALLNLKNTVFESSDTHQPVTKDSSAAAKDDKKKSKIRTLAKSGFATVTVGSKLIDISQKVDTLAGQATDAVQVCFFVAALYFFLVWFWWYSSRIRTFCSSYCILLIMFNLHTACGDGRRHSTHFAGSD